jgi:two-component system sensor histidine kinase DesK
MMAWLRPHPDSLLGRMRPASYLRWQAGLQLFWLVVLIQVSLAVQPFAWRWMAPTLLTIPFYVFLYLRLYIGPLRQFYVCIGGIAALGYVLLPVNPFAFVYVVCAGVALGLCASWRHWLGGIAAMVLLIVPYVAFLGQKPTALWVVLIGSLFGGFSNFLYITNTRRDAELRLSQDDVRRLTMLAERERIGRDLHDLLGHTLSLVALKSELARRLALADPPRAQREMEEVERVARHALTEVRAAVTGMRRGDIAAELVSARLMLEASGVSFDSELLADMDLPTGIEASLALVLREAITNVHRHARARAASVRFARDDSSIVMTIVDDGCGGLNAHGNGVGGMRERVRALGGTLRIESPPRRGTTLRVIVALPTLPVSIATIPEPPSAANDEQRSYA